MDVSRNSAIRFWLSTADTTSMQNVVAHFTDGSTLKGSVATFRQKEPDFRLIRADGEGAVEVQVADLKGLFFVRDLDSDGTNRSREDVDRVGLGRKVKVQFHDDETLIGYTNGYGAHRPTFWVTPADPKSNNDRIFVVTAATAEVTFVE